VSGKPDQSYKTETIVYYTISDESA
jgi:hypothetical protein